MPSDRLDIRLNGGPLADERVELIEFQIGYYGRSSVRLSDRSRQHDLRPYLSLNDLIEISRDNFATLVWKGRITHVEPGGLGEEGLAWQAESLESILNRYVMSWNLRGTMSYNDNNQTALDAPNWVTSGGSIDPDARWTVGEVVIDILEHVKGLTAASSIPRHHPDPSTVRFPVVTGSSGPGDDHLDKLTWDAAEITAALDFSVPNLVFSSIGIWDLLEELVQNGGNHGCFIDPTTIDAPKFVVHKFDNSNTVTVQAGTFGSHAFSSGFRVLSNKFTFDATPVRNRIIIEGRPKVGSTDPGLAASEPLSGKLVKLDSAGKVWRVQNQDLIPFIAGYDVTDPNRDSRDLSVQHRENYGPVLYSGNTPLHTFGGKNVQPRWILHSGVMISNIALSGDLRVKTLFEIPFRIVVGPGPGISQNRPATGAGSAPRYPTPTPWDAYTHHGIRRDLYIRVDEFVHSTRQSLNTWFTVRTQPPINPGDNDGMFQPDISSSDALEQEGFPLIADKGVDRDDTVSMLLWAEEIQRRFRDIRIKLIIELDQIKLESLYSTTGTEPGLRKRLSLANLDLDRWSDAELQVMAVKVDVQKDRMELECSNDVYSVSSRPPTIWFQKQMKRQAAFEEERLRRLMAADTQMQRAGGGEIQTDQMHGRLVRYPAPYGTFVAYGDPDVEPKLSASP